MGPCCDRDVGHRGDRVGPEATALALAKVGGNSPAAGRPWLALTGRDLTRQVN